MTSNVGDLLFSQSSSNQLVRARAALLTNTGAGKRLDPQGNSGKDHFTFPQDSWERKVHFSLGVSAVFWVVWDTWLSQLHESTKTFCKHFSRPCQRFNRKQLIPVLVIHSNLCVQVLEWLLAMLLNSNLRVLQWSAFIIKAFKKYATEGIPASATAN